MPELRGAMGGYALKERTWIGSDPSCDIVLSDGATAHIRPITPGDGQLLVDATSGDPAGSRAVGFLDDHVAAPHPERPSVGHHDAHPLVAFEFVHDVTELGVHAAGYKCNITDPNDITSLKNYFLKE